MKPSCGFIAVALVVTLRCADASAGTLSLVSADAVGLDGGSGRRSGPIALTSDGRFVVFQSRATNLVPIPTNGASRNLFIRDLQGGTTALVSINAAGTAGSNGDCSSASITRDGRFVLFQSRATDLVSVPTNSTFLKIFVRDLQQGTTTLMSINASGTAGINSDAGGARMSRDGRHVVFQSRATDAVRIPTKPGAWKLFVRDIQAATTTLVCVNKSGGAGANDDCASGRMTRDGRYVLFQSKATDLVTTPTAPGLWSVFVRDLEQATTTLVSVNIAGTAGVNSDAIRAGITPDGRAVLFQSKATDAVPLAAGTDSWNLFVRDLTRSTTTLVNMNASGTGAANSDAGGGKISHDGRYVLFQSRATDLVSVPTDGAVSQVYLRDLQQGSTTLISAKANGSAGGNGDSEAASLTGTGRFVIFQSKATDLVPIPTASTSWKVFVSDLFSTSPSYPGNCDRESPPAADSQPQAPQLGVGSLPAVP